MKRDACQTKYEQKSKKSHTLKPTFLTTLRANPNLSCVVLFHRSLMLMLMSMVGPE
ncbi:hypothetical protein Hanom_Chr05g00419871 [Helianthus anomalus]